MRAWPPVCRPEGWAGGVSDAEWSLQRRGWRGAIWDRGTGPGQTRGMLGPRQKKDVLPPLVSLERSTCNDAGALATGVLRCDTTSG